MEKLFKTENRVEVVGVVRDNKLEIKQSKKGVNMVIGSLIVEVEEGNNVEFKVLSMEKNGKGETNKGFAGLKTVAETYSVGDRISVNGGLSLNDYYSEQRNEVVTTQQLDGRFFSRVNSDVEAKNDITLEGCLRRTWTKTKVNAVTEEETEELWAEIVGVGYDEKSATPFEVKIADDIKDEFLEAFEKGQTIVAYCTAKNYKFEKVNEISGLGGKVRKEVKTSYERGIELYNANPMINENKQLDIEALGTAVKEREIVLEQLKNQKPKEDVKQKPVLNSNDIPF